MRTPRLQTSDQSPHSNRMWAPAVLVRYTLLHIPMIALLVVVVIVSRESTIIPTWPAVILLVGWVVKDIVVYPSVWRSYLPEQHKATNPLIGACGIAKSDLDPGGMVAVGSELWRAEAAKDSMAVKEGDAVEIVQTRGLILVVKLHRDS